MTKTTQLRIPVVLATAALAAAGCGGTATPPSPATGSAPPKNIVSAAYRFSRCMRQHGVTGFPDPVVRSSPGHESVGIRITPVLTGSPQFKSAQKACQGIMPGPGPGNGGPSAAQTAARVKGLVAFAGCMRSHHVPTFPDPTTQGQITPSMLTAAGIDLHAPAARAAAVACVPASGGQLTAAQVAQALGPA
ncbi:MAG: hypothetical protein M3071_14560 [Actinomycetota bacterium]|nr:hypothetical protein [Actinomycetota bacterium]